MNKSCEETTTLCIEIPFPSSRLAEIALHSLRVDTEPRRGGTTKTLEIEENKLIAYFAGSNLSSIRVSKLFSYWGSLLVKSIATLIMPEHTPAPTPSRAVYGFAMYFSFRLFFCLYLIWAVVPESYFRSLGITCLPHRYWAVSVPIFLLTAFAVFALVIYPSFGLCMTPDINDIHTIRDEVGCKKNKKLCKLLSPKICGKKDVQCCQNPGICHKKYFKSDEGDVSYQSIPVLKDLEIWEIEYYKIKPKQTPTDM